MRLPPVSSRVAATAVAGLPTRVRRRVEATILTLKDKHVEISGTQLRVEFAPETVVTAQLHDGIIYDETDVECTCLLNPACVHRASVLLGAPIADEDDEGPDGAPEVPEAVVNEIGSTSNQFDNRATLGTDEKQHGDAEPRGKQCATAAQRACAEQALVAIIQALAVGASGTDPVVHTNLLRVAHSCRVQKLFRLSALTTAVASSLWAGRLEDAAFSAATLVDSFAQALYVATRVQFAESLDVRTELGLARGSYTDLGAVRLFGLYCEPIVTDSGYAGANTILADESGQLFEVGDVRPGDESGAKRGAVSPLEIGDATGTVRDLARGGLILNAATHRDGRLGRGKAVKAVSVSGASWWDEPLTRLWEVQPEQQIEQVLRRDRTNERRSGWDLVFLNGIIDNATPSKLKSGTLRLSLQNDREIADFPANLRLLRTLSGVPLRLVARLNVKRPSMVAPLALAWPNQQSVDLGFEALSLGAIPQGSIDEVDRGEPLVEPMAVELIDAAVRRVVLGGVATARIWAGHTDLPARSRAEGLYTAAQLVEKLMYSTGSSRENGRLLSADEGSFADAWLNLVRYRDALVLTLHRDLETE